MSYKDRLQKAVDYAIDTHYEIQYRAKKVHDAIYSHKNVCVFGTGEFFRDCAHPMHLLRFEYVGDNNPMCWGKYFKGRKCLSPHEIAEMDDIVVLIMIGEWRPVYNQLSTMGICCYPMDWYSLNVYDIHYSDDWFETQRESIIGSIDLFADEASQEVYVEAICNRIAPPLAKKIFNEIKIPGEYFDSDVFKMTSEEYLVDAGAYNGDSIEKFCKITKGKYGAIYAFELDSNIFVELQEKVKPYDNGHIELYHAGVSDVNTTLSYSFIQGSQSQTEKVVALDNILKNKKVTYIKMDVETYESRALEGAKSIIASQHPKLCISAYHYLYDLWKIPQKIRNIVPDYKLYLRHHSPCVWDTDCYALCNEV